MSPFARLAGLAFPARVPRRPQPARRQGRRPSAGLLRHGLAAERLEPRTLLAVTPLLVGSELQISITDGDTATLTYDSNSGQYTVASKTFQSTDVQSISATDDNNAASVFTLASDIPSSANLHSINVSVGGGNTGTGKGGTINLNGALTTVGSASNNQFYVGTTAGSLGTISIAGKSLTGTSNQQMNFQGPVTLADDLSVTTKNGLVNFLSTLDGNYAFTAATGTSQVNLSGKVGGAAPLAGIRILTGGMTQSPNATITLDASKAKGTPLTAGIIINDGCNVQINAGGTISNFQYYGVVVRGGTVGGTNATIQGFTLASNGQAGIGVQQGQNATLTIGGSTNGGPNTITGSGVAGILVDGQGTSSTITITDNAITMPVKATTTTGILLSGNFTATGNTLSLQGNVIQFDSTGPGATGPTYGICLSPSAGGAINAHVGVGGLSNGNIVTAAAAGQGTTGILASGNISGTTIVNNILSSCAYGVVLSGVTAATAAIVQQNLIDAGGAKVAPQIGISMQGAQNVTVGGGVGVNATGNTITAYPIGLYARGTSTGSSVQGNTISSTGYSTSAGIGIMLDAATSLSVGAAGIGTANTISKACVGVYAAGGLAGTTVYANTIEDTYQGVVLSSAKNLLLGSTGGLGNTLRQKTSGTNPFLIGIYATGDSAGTQIQSNTLTNTADTTKTSSFGLFLDGVTNLTVGGAISGATNPGNSVNGFYSGCLAQNTLAGTSLQGNVFASGTAASKTVIGLQLMQAQGLAAGGTNDQNNTRGNTFAQCSAFGGYATGTSTGTTLTGNIISGDNFGFYASDATGVSLDSNYLYTNAAAGVAVVGASSETVLQSNTIYANTGGGIQLTGGANQGVAAPALTSFTYDSSKMTGAAVGTLTGVAGKTYRIQYFTTPSILAAQGRTLLTLAGGANYEDVTLAGSSISLSPTFTTASPNPGIAAGDVLTATATLLQGGPGSNPVATSAFSSQTATYGTAVAPLAVAFDTTNVGTGLGASNIYVSIQPGQGPGGLSGFLVTYNSQAGTNQLVSFGLPSDVISTPLSLADITDPVTNKPTLYVTQGVSLSTFVSYGKAMVPSSSAPSVIDPTDPNYLTRFQQFELTRNYPGQDGDQGNLTHINYFTAPMSLANYESSDPANLGTALQQKWVGITASTGQQVYDSLSKIPGITGSKTTTSAVVADTNSDVVRVIGPSTFTSGLPYPSLLDYVKSLAGNEPKIWNYNGFQNASGSVAYQVNLGGAAYDSNNYNDPTNHLTMSVATDGTIKVYGKMTITQTAGGSTTQQYTATEDSPWMLISPNQGATPAEQIDNFNLAIYGQAATTGQNYAAVTYPSSHWHDMKLYLDTAGANANAEPKTTTQALLVGEVTSAILLGFANAAPIASPYGPLFSGTVYPAGYSTAQNTPTITYDGVGGNPPPIAIKDMRSREWWNFAPTPGTPSAVQLQPSTANYNQYASIIQTASSNETYTIPYSDRLGTGPLIQTVKYNTTAVGTIVVGLGAPISAPPTVTPPA